MLALLCLLLLSSLAPDSAMGCNPQSDDISDYAFSAVLEVMPPGSAQDWQLVLELGDSSQPFQYLNAFEIGVKFDEPLAEGIVLTADWTGSWCASAATNKQIRLNAARDSLTILLELPGCDTVSGFGVIGKVYFGDTGDVDVPETTTQGIVMIDNIVGKSARPEAPPMGKGMRLFPNPASSHATLDPGGLAIAAFALYNEHGKLIRRGDAPQGPVHFDTSLLAPGIYLLEVRMETGERRLLKLLVAR